MTDLLTVFGGPGCGKTTRLLSIVEDELARGVSSKDICYTTFTVKAADEAKERAVKKFGLDPKEDMPWFSTLHSICFRAIGASRGDVLKARQYNSILSAIIGNQTRVAGDYDESAGLWRGSQLGDRLIFAEQLSRLTGTPINAYARELEFLPDVANKWIDALAAHKERHGKIDFIDMLEQALTTDRLPPVRVLIVDEAQDLSPLQWRVVEKMAARAERVYIGGDDDQAIYDWAGADVKGFLSIAERGRKEILPVSHRLPPAVFNAATNILRRIKLRQPKDWSPADKKGAVLPSIPVADAIRVLNLHEDAGSWYFLGRTEYQLRVMRDALIREAVPFAIQGESMLDKPSVRAARAWTRLQKRQPVAIDDVKSMLHFVNDTHVTNRARMGEIEEPLVTADRLEQVLGLKDLDKEWFKVLSITARMENYIRAIRRKGYALDTVPWINVSTIHRVKGGEADNVWLDTALTKSAGQRLLTKENDSEHRVFYVGASRARRNLYVPFATTFYSYPRFF